MDLLLVPHCWKVLSNRSVGAAVFCDGRGPLGPLLLCCGDSVSLGMAAELSGPSVTLLCRQGMASPWHSQGSLKPGAVLLICKDAYLGCLATDSGWQCLFVCVWLLCDGPVDVGVTAKFTRQHKTHFCCLTKKEELSGDPTVCSFVPLSHGNLTKTPSL